MKTKRDTYTLRKNAALWLVAVAAVLLLSKTVIDAGGLAGVFAGSRTDEVQPEYISPEKIDSLFHFSIDEFALDDKLVRKINLPERKDRLGKNAYDITVPANLPIPVILENVFESFSSLPVTISCEEEKIDGDSFLQLSARDTVWLSAELNIDKDLMRKFGSIGFLLKDFGELSPRAADSLLAFPELFTALVKPSPAGVELTGRTEDRRKDYLLMLADDVEFEDFRLKPEYSKRRMNASIKAITKAFPKNKIYLIDHTSELYNSMEYNWVEERFKEYGYRIAPLNAVEHLRGETKQETVERFREMVSGSGPGSETVILISSQDYLTIQSEVKKMRYRGINVVPAASILTGRIDEL